MTAKIVDWDGSIYDEVSVSDIKTDLLLWVDNWTKQGYTVRFSQ